MTGQEARFVLDGTKPIRMLTIWHVPQGAVNTHENWLVLTGLHMLQGLAADQAGMRQGDEIISIDGTPADTLTPFQVSMILRTAAPPALTSPSPPNPDSKPPAQSSPSTPGSGLTTSADTGVSWSTLSIYLTTTSSTSVDSSPTAAVVQVVHEDGTPETLRVLRGKGAAVANPIANVSLRGDSGFVKLRTFNARAAPELRVRLLVLLLLYMHNVFSFSAIAQCNFQLCLPERCSKHPLQQYQHLNR